jgi:regulator of replication initiation timing
MNKEIQIIEKRVAKCEELKFKIVVNSQETYDQALEFGKNVNRLIKEVDAQEKDITKPINDSLKKIRDAFRPAKDKLEAIKKEIAGVMVEYINAENAKKKLEAERLEARLERGTIREDTVIKKLAIAEETKTVTKGGMTSVLTVKIIDKTKIPMDYLIVDESKIKSAHRSGIKIPGVICEYKNVARM